MENPIKMDDLEGKPTIFGNIHMVSKDDNMLSVSVAQMFPGFLPCNSITWFCRSMSSTESEANPSFQAFREETFELTHECSSKMPWVTRWLDKCWQLWEVWKFIWEQIDSVLNGFQRMFTHYLTPKSAPHPSPMSSVDLSKNHVIGLICVGVKHYESIQARCYVLKSPLTWESCFINQYHAVFLGLGTT